MERSDFADLDSEPRWWLIADEIRSELVELRKDLTQALGYTNRDERWYDQRPDVEAFYDRLANSDGQHLLVELDAVTDDSAQLKWLTDAVEFLRKTDETPTEAVPAAAEATETAAPATASPAPSDAKPSPFAKKRQAEVALAIDSAIEAVMPEVGLDNAEELARELGKPVDEVRQMLANLPDNFEEMLRDRIKDLTQA